MSATTIDAVGPRSSFHPGRASGLVLSPLTWLLVALGTVGGLVFTAAYTLEGATRQGYDWLAQPISALSLGPGGWVQRANFVLFGLLMVVSAVGWRRLLAAGRAAVAFPGLRTLAGVALILTASSLRIPRAGIHRAPRRRTRSLASSTLDSRRSRSVRWRPAGLCWRAGSRPSPGGAPGRRPLP